mgnify:CR=1 FL=1
MLLLNTDDHARCDHDYLGRVTVKPLAFWANQVIERGADGGYAPTFQILQVTNFVTTESAASMSRTNNPFYLPKSTNIASDRQQPRDRILVHSV